MDYLGRPLIQGQMSLQETEEETERQTEEKAMGKEPSTGGIAWVIFVNMAGKFLEVKVQIHIWEGCFF